MHKIQHPPPNKPEHNPHNWTPPKYGQTIQLAPLSDNLPILPVARIKRVQQIIGSLLYYAWAVDNTLLLTLNNIAAEQSQATTDTEKQIHKLLNYVATHHNASITYNASNMILKIHSDASYLSAKHSRSRAGRYFYMGKIVILSMHQYTLSAKLWKTYSHQQQKQKLAQFF